MAVQKGKDLLLKIDKGGSFVTIGGLRTKRLAFNAETVDVTDSESSGRWRELLGGAGVQRAALSGQGLFKDGESDALVRAAFFASSLLTWQLILPDFGSITGLFQIAGLTYSGSFNGEMLFEIALESAGPLSFVAL
ncbi:phage major tail protein, TP901-1 family [Xaviernesmea oryzae]|uniref:Phage major tail protein, TP901-1 family n=1 Tax=Xaviernesmea oryzae TaxID=464029 RepID=A0A1Q9B1I7_9HYPH|nr:phage major tail protein, TP901-1 family [Xaviernesmea oryzae]OLP61854.1 phage major tail protein, TP901-1 family [Xaviernesmea oryzae]SEL75324.1 phage major tail protein, TP901-1 family [Xaviernesmea oryzae]